jgi:penicillin amidase
MRLIKLFFSLALLVTLVTLLNVNIGRVPPLGKFFDPFGGFWQNAEATRPNLPNVVNLSGLRQAVEVKFDENLIPHIKAKNDHDLYLVQGYITAYHRLWQMDFQYYAASGRLSEIFGEVTLQHDRLQRRKGLGKIAERILDNAANDPILMDILNSYSQGVNEFIKSLNYKNLPLEYKIFNYVPEPWAPLKTAFINAFMVDILSGKDAALEYTNAINMLGYERFNFIYPDYPNSLKPIVSSEGNFNFTPSIVENRELEIPKAINSYNLPEEEFHNGSNNWVLSSIKTGDKNVYLANDPHLDLNLPPIWYLVHVESPGSNVFGATSPGAPSILIGFNEHIAWGITNSMSNVRDWYTVDFKDKDKSTYMYDGSPLKTNRVVEKIKVKNKPDFCDTVIYTHHGPIVYDEEFNKEGNHVNLAMRWTGHMPDKEILTFHLLAKAKSYSDFKKAFEFYNVPNLNLAFASREDIAMHVMGVYPLKFKDQGKFIMPGSKSEYLWNEFIPRDQMPHTHNPQCGYLVSANQHPTDSQYPYYHHSHAYNYYRHRRIDDVLCKLKNATVQDMMNLQSDDYNLCAAENVPTLISYIDCHDLDQDQTYFYDKLQSWNFRDDIQYEGPSIFKVWTKTLLNELWKFLDKQNLKVFRPSLYVTMEIVKNHPDSPYLDFGEYGSLKNVINETFKQSVAQLTEWSTSNKKSYKWGNYKKVWINHIAKLDAFSIKNLKVNGSLSTVNVSEGILGASLKLIVELGSTSRCWLIYPGGQSGNPGSKYYLNFLDKWLKNEYIQINLDQTDLHNTLFKVIFKP